MLSVDIDELNSQLPEDTDRHRNTIDSANVFPVQIDFPLNRRLGLVGHAVFREPRILRHILKDCAHGGLLHAGPDHIAVGALAQNGGDCVDHNGFARAGFACHHVEAGLKQNVRPLNDGNILYMQQTEHVVSLFYSNILRISLQKSAADSLSRMMTSVVSSPDSVPRTVGIFSASILAPAALPSPGIVLTTIRFCA